MDNKLMCGPRRHVFKGVNIEFGDPPARVRQCEGCKEWIHPDACELCDKQVRQPLLLERRGMVLRHEDGTSLPDGRVCSECYLKHYPGSDAPSEETRGWSIGP